MRFKILYVLFLIVSVMFSRSMLIGPISLRHVLAVVMFIYCIAIGGFKIDKFTTWYSVFLVFYTLSNIITGYTTEVLMKLFGTYFSVIVLYMATKVMIQKYDGLNWIIFTLLTIAVIDSVVTIGQYYNNPIAKTISEFIRGDDFDEELYEDFERRMAWRSIAVAGVLGAVLNGYFLSAVCILGLYNIKGEPGIINWALFLFLAFALFLVQERSGLYFGLLCAFMYVFLTSVTNKKSIITIMLVLPIVLFLIVEYGSSFVNLGDTRYFTQALNNGGRDELAAGGWAFIADHPLGGIMEFHALGNRDSHNAVTNAFLFGGVFGGIVVLSIILAQLWAIIKILYKSYQQRRYSFALIVFSLMYLDLALNSFFHNASLTTGNVLFFLVWGVIVSLLEKESNVDRKLPKLSIS